MRSLPASRRRRLQLAEALAEDSAPLVADLVQSVSLLTGIDRGCGAFCGPREEPACDLAEVAHRERPLRTADFAFWLQRNRYLDVALEPRLACEYVERELVPTSGGPRNRRSATERPAGLRVDLLLVNADPADRTPVVAEVKIGTDKDPFAGLVQALAGIVHLATPAQYRRLRAVYGHARFPGGAVPPPLDAYVLCVDPVWDTPCMSELLLAAREIARNLSRAGETAAILRRAVLLQVERAPGRLWSEATRL